MDPVASTAILVCRTVASNCLVYLVSRTATGTSTACMTDTGTGVGRAGVARGNTKGLVVIVVSVACLDADAAYLV